MFYFNFFTYYLPHVNPWLTWESRTTVWKPRFTDPWMTTCHITILCARPPQLENIRLGAEGA